jgi:hypothetical protein
MQKGTLATPRLRSVHGRQAVSHSQVRRENLRRELRPLHPSVYAGEVFVESDWLQIPLSPEWVACFRLVSRGRGGRRYTEPVELRIHPYEASAEPGEWSGIRKGRGAHLPSTRFSFALVRQIVTEGVFKRALTELRASLERQHALGAFNNPVPARTKRSDSRDRGRPGGKVREYAELALRYDELEAQRDTGESTRRRLARELKVEETTIAKRLQQARRMGFLEKVRPGQRGSRATPLALRTVEGDSGRRTGSQ